MSGLSIQEAARVITSASPEELALASWFYRWGIFRHPRADPPQSLEDNDFIAAATWIRTSKLVLQVMAPPQATSRVRRERKGP